MQQRALPTGDDGSSALVRVVGRPGVLVVAAARREGADEQHGEQEKEMTADHGALPPAVGPDDCPSRRRTYSRPVRRAAVVRDPCVVGPDRRGTAR